ncbi:MAG: hypothetical protein NWE92_13385 [Candidatus Bathyarchaeota archaeon]|nr:hypothetical protein [Candidatus Bathyarchaeota archaeon]
MNRTIATLLVTAIIIVLSTAITSISAAEEDRDKYNSAPPIISILDNENAGVPIDYIQHTMHPTIYSDTENVTLWIKVRLPYQVHNSKLQGDLMWFGGHITAVSYKASWLNNQTVKIYTNNSNEGPHEFNFTLTNIPYGRHYLEVNASCVVFILNDLSGLSSHPFRDSAETSLDITVLPVSTPTPQPTPMPSPTTFNLRTEHAVTIVAVILSVAVFLAVFYRRHPKGSTTRSATIPQQ